MSTNRDDEKINNQILILLGHISGKLEQMEKAQSRTVFALIGIIAAQIGVKVLGTPILLDIATTIGIVGIFILVGVLTQGLSVIRRKCKITSTGMALVIMMGWIAVVQVMVYFRDLGWLSPDIIYVARIVQNVAILVFAWRMMVNHNITTDKPDDPGSCTK